MEPFLCNGTTIDSSHFLGNSCVLKETSKIVDNGRAKTKDNFLMKYDGNLSGPEEKHGLILFKAWNTM